MGKLLQEAEYACAEKAKNVEKEVVGTAYWAFTTAIYLGCSFWTGRWGVTWVVWPVAVALYAVLESVLRLTLWRQDEPTDR